MSTEASWKQSCQVQAHTLPTSSPNKSVPFHSFTYKLTHCLPSFQIKTLNPLTARYFFSKV